MKKNDINFMVGALAPSLYFYYIPRVLSKKGKKC